MGFGILEPKTTAHVPGTELLHDEAASTESAAQGLKHASGKDSHIILAPQPSGDPNDPLNWSWIEKHVVLGVLCFGSIVNAAALVRAPYTDLLYNSQLTFIRVRYWQPEWSRYPWSLRPP